MVITFAASLESASGTNPPSPGTGWTGRAGSSVGGNSDVDLLDNSQRVIDLDLNIRIVLSIFDAQGEAGIARPRWPVRPLR